MATSYGFFNSVSGDRLYNADDVNTFLEGLVSDGIYANVDDMFVVTAGTGMSVKVAAGKASLAHHWFKSDAIETLEIGSAHAVLQRYDVVAIRLNYSTREIGFTVIQGTPATSPQVPAIRRDDEFFDLALAYVLVGAGVTAISQSVITDVRLNTAVCGVVTGIIDQLDTTTFMLQLLAWMDAEKTAFETWFATLTEQLEVNAYIAEYVKNVEFYYPTDQVPRAIALDMGGYVPDANSIVEVFIDGSMLPPKSEYYTLNAIHSMLYLTDRGNPEEDSAHIITVRVLQSKIGNPPQYDTMTALSVSESEENEITTEVTVQSEG